MARLCKACRQPLDGDPRDHDCPEADLPGPEERFANLKRTNAQAGRSGFKGGVISCVSLFLFSFCQGRGGR